VKDWVVCWAAKPVANSAANSVDSMDCSSVVSLDSHSVVKSGANSVAPMFYSSVVSSGRMSVAFTAIVVKKVVQMVDRTVARLENGSVDYLVACLANR
jgi:hypothetical protein